MIADYRWMHRDRNMVSSSPRRSIVGRHWFAAYKPDGESDDDPCPTVWTSVMAGNEPPGVDADEPLPYAESV